VIKKHEKTDKMADKLIYWSMNGKDSGGRPHLRLQVGGAAEAGVRQFKTVVNNLEGRVGACSPPALASKDFHNNRNLILTEVSIFNFELFSVSIVSSLLEISFSMP